MVLNMADVSNTMMPPPKASPLTKAKTRNSKQPIVTTSDGNTRRIKESGRSTLTLDMETKSGHCNTSTLLSGEVFAMSSPNNAFKFTKLMDTPEMEGDNKTSSAPSLSQEKLMSPDHSDHQGVTERKRMSPQAAESLLQGNLHGFSDFSGQDNKGALPPNSTFPSSLETNVDHNEPIHETWQRCMETIFEELKTVAEEWGPHLEELHNSQEEAQARLEQLCDEASDLRQTYENQMKGLESSMAEVMLVFHK
ncbi:uncharacterized protein LOC143036583 [Oratosquilla oratoria]|uniref:uncharacterized protein LOC143036583 n=1 Tax=Oratosquilla oratoria TaxID=337810 RepID=UPI003F76A94B